ncbi:Matrix metalloproteinase-16, partial [Hypsibius exemplaris]
ESSAATGRTHQNFLLRRTKSYARLLSAWDFRSPNIESTMQYISQQVPGTSSGFDIAESIHRRLNGSIPPKKRKVADRRLDDTSPGKLWSDQFVREALEERHKKAFDVAKKKQDKRKETATVIKEFEKQKKPVKKNLEKRAKPAKPLRREERGIRDTLSKAKDYLESFGWLPSWNPETFRAATTNVMKKAIRMFQRFWGLPESGEIDEKTQELMAKPRCGVADNVASVDDGTLVADAADGGDIEAARRKRYIIQKQVQFGQKWRRKDLKYRITKYSQKIPSSVVDGVIRKALYEWQKVSPFNITLKETGPVHMEIRFEPGDGPGKALAYAYGPGTAEGGDIRFDEYEDWTVRTTNGQNLYMVALHEIGHTFGLDHSNTPGAIMNPYYTGYVQGKGLQPDDIAGIQAIYGPPSSRPMATQLPKAVVDPTAQARKNKVSSVYGNICELPQGEKVINGLTITADKKIYAFKGQHFFELTQDRSGGIAPQLIRNGWVGLPDTIDSVFTGPEGFTFFFKGEEFWKFKNRQMEPGYPKPISKGFPGAPTNIDAVFVYNPNKKIYFVKGDQYWRFEPGASRRVADGYPKSLREWKKLPARIDAAALWRDGRTYFFSGKNYYKFNDFKFAVEDGYPKSVASWWFACDETAATSNGDVVETATDASI